jgi:Zn-dependent M28 family amino/carboxypeptidase
VGANDGASGVAILAELGHHMASVAEVGVDFVLFDGEEFVFDDDRDKYFIGSEYFARDYATKPPTHRYRYGVLLDMVGDANLQIFQEGNSVTWRDSAPLVYDIWRTARGLGVREFIPRPGHTIRDDHLALHDIAGIPSCDIIDFDYPRPGARGSYWHTTLDTPDKCSPLSLAKVGWVVLEWLKGLE